MGKNDDSSGSSLTCLSHTSAILDFMGFMLATVATWLPMWLWSSTQTAMLDFAPHQNVSVSVHGDPWNQSISMGLWVAGLVGKDPIGDSPAILLENVKIEPTGEWLSWESLINSTACHFHDSHTSDVLNVYWAERYELCDEITSGFQIPLVLIITRLASLAAMGFALIGGVSSVTFLIRMKIQSESVTRLCRGMSGFYSALATVAGLIAVLAFVTWSYPAKLVSEEHGYVPISAFQSSKSNAGASIVPVPVQLTWGPGLFAMAAFILVEMLATLGHCASACCIPQVEYEELDEPEPLSRTFRSVTFA